MTESTIYRCDHCKRTFHKETDALRCEERHRPPRTILSATYGSEPLGTRSYPQSIRVMLEGYNVGVYLLDHLE